jgi:ABC-type protease/lipase transport system fused ATPase/permease subunit
LRAIGSLRKIGGLQRENAVVVRHISSTVEPVEKVLFLTDGRLNSFKIATFLAHFDFSYSLVSSNK